MVIRLRSKYPLLKKSLSTWFIGPSSGVWWFCEVSVYLSAWPSGCEQLHLIYIYITRFFQLSACG